MRRSSMPRTLARAATVAALAAAVTVPTLGSAPAFASSYNHWVYEGSYDSRDQCRYAGHQWQGNDQHRHWFCDHESWDSNWDLYYWEHSPTH
jgi:hypothetical protein